MDDELGDLIVGLDPQDLFQRRIATDFAEASVIGCMAQQRREQSDAPEQRDWEVIAASAPRLPKVLQERGIGNSLHAATDDPQRGGVLECRPGEQRLSDGDPHR